MKRIPKIDFMYPGIYDGIIKATRPKDKQETYPKPEEIKKYLENVRKIWKMLEKYGRNTRKIFLKKSVN
jgi:hypothetical protein